MIYFWFLKINQNFYSLPLMIYPDKNHSHDELIIQKTSFNTINIEEVSQPKECRICLQNENQSDRQLITPCRCTGSVQFVHQECIKSWIKSKMESQSRWDRAVITKQGLKCEMCNTAIKFTYEIESSCRNWPQFLQTLKDKRKIFIIVLFIFIISIGGLSICLFTLTNLLNPEKKVDFQIIIVVCGTILLFCFLAVAIYTCIAEFCFLQRGKIGQIQDISKYNKKKDEQNPNDTLLKIIDLV